MPNPYGSNQVSSLPLRKIADNTPPGSSPGVPPKPSDTLLVANNVQPTQTLLTSTKLTDRLDANTVTGRIAIDVQNNGPNTVEIYPGVANPTFGGPGWVILSGGWFSFPWTEDVKVYAVIAAGGSADIRVFQQVKQ